MKVSLNWIKQFTDVDVPVDELVQRIGAQLGAVEEVIDLGAKYQGIIIAKVVSCEKHPNADKLSVCLIDDGGKAKKVERNKDGHVQVVCGAPNVSAGMLVAWLPPGSTVPSSYDKEPFVLEARELRGVVSNGMLASAHELALSDDHTGILEIENSREQSGYAPGDDFAEAFGLNDYIIDIENKMFTHRPDCFGWLGVARELAGIQHKAFKSPDWYEESPKLPEAETAPLPLEVKNPITELVPRFTAIALSGVKVKQSPVWLQAELAKVGLNPINNIVDYTNLFMLETGQPLHAYDYDKLAALAASKDSGQAVNLATRLSRPGDKLKLLNGKEITFENDATILITSGDVPVGVGGIMGGAETEVDENTRNIVLECANFDMYSIRRTSMHYGLFTDAVTRFNKGQSQLQNLAVLAKVVKEIREHAGGKVASEVFDEKGKISRPIAVHVRADFINARLGLDMKIDDMAKLLKNVEFDVRVNGPTLAVTPPFWRTDIEIAEDVVEEVGRLYGYDHLPRELPLRTIAPVRRNELLDVKSRLRDTLAGFGANEVLTYSFVHGDLLENSGQDKDQAFRISNAISPDLQYYRLSLIPSLLEKVRPNIKAGYDEFAIFEIGKAHVKGQMDSAEPTVPKEFQNLALVVSAADKLKKTGAAYYQAKLYLDSLAAALGLKLDYQPVKQKPPYQAGAPFEPKRSALIRIKGTDKPIGMVGEFKTATTSGLKLPRYTAGFEIDTTKLPGAVDNSSGYVEQPRFPKVQQDITLKLPADIMVGELESALADELRQNLPADDYLLEIKLTDIYQHDDAIKHVTFRVKLAHYARTLIDQEVNKLLDDAAKSVGYERA